MREGLPMEAEDYWPEEDIEFEDDEFDEADFEDWSLEEDVRRLLADR